MMSPSDRDLHHEAALHGRGVITVPCGRCSFLFYYPEGTPWNIVNDMVNGHWNVCPGSISASVAKSRHVATDPRYPPPFAGARQDNREGSSSNDENDGDPNSKRNRKKNMMDESERKKKLEDDPWALEVTPISVRCGACTRLVSLDKRSRFYPGLWLKHREKCMEIKRLEAIEQEQGDKSESSSAVQSPPKKKAKGLDSTATTPDVTSPASRSTEVRESATCDTARVVFSPSIPPTSPSDNSSRREVLIESRPTSEARDPTGSNAVYLDDSGGPRLIGKRRRSPSSDSEAETLEDDENRKAPFSTDEAYDASYLPQPSKYRHATWRELRSNFRGAYNLRLTGEDDVGGLNRTK
ncbi:hypothetical protein PC9H_005504 [Pleurotus ostreatus]|uniref:Uncharacterized protein n=1 Tax=Pleurotus ostreatus TaxID=5322 RepID=A0A8H6ZZN0_PLEOS|nr:uncharacterized protein PC9H_005504 [Pleurotus ostreatus]KAF7433546.1 hypothetical protein PC9H_005504 [Pleurotus ostreatus]